MKNIKLLLSVTAISLSLSACSTWHNPFSNVTPVAEPLVTEVAVEEPKVSDVTSAVSFDELPEEANAGQCFAKLRIAPEYEEYTEQVLVKEEGEEVQTIPAEYGMVEEQVLVKEATQEIRVIPATYKTITEEVLVKDAVEKVIDKPAEYTTVKEKILVKPASKIWKKGRGSHERIDNATGEIMCLVEVPAEYKTISRRVLQTPASTVVEQISPAEYKTVTREVIDVPATTEVIEIPAVYKTVKTNKILTPSQTVSTPVPAVYGEVTKRRLVSPGGSAWRPVLCETNTTKDVIKQIQLSLRDEGFDPGRIDGVIGRDTMQAVGAYQRSKGFAEGALTMETLNALGVTL